MPNMINRRPTERDLMMDTCDDESIIHTIDQDGK